MKTHTSDEPVRSPDHGGDDAAGHDPRDRPTPEGDGLDPTRYGDWEKNGRCIDF